MVASAFIATVLLALAAAVSTVIVGRAYNSERKQRAITSVALREAEQAKRGNQALLVQTLIEKGCGEFNEGDVSGLHTFLEACRAARGNPSLEACARDYWTLAHAWLAGSIVDVLPSPLASAIHHKGNLIAWCDDSAVYLRDLSNHRDRRLITPTGLLEIQRQADDDHHDFLGLCFSPDGRYLGLNNADRGAACLWTLAAAEDAPRVLLHPDRPPLYRKYLMGHHTLCFSPDSSRLATAASNRTLCVWDVQKGELVSPPIELDYPTSSVSFDPSGRRIAVSFQDDAFEHQPESDPPAIITVFDLHDRQSRGILLEHQGRGGVLKVDSWMKGGSPSLTSRAHRECGTWIANGNCFLSIGAVGTRTLACLMTGNSWPLAGEMGRRPSGLQLMGSRLSNRCLMAGEACAASHFRRKTTCS